MLIIIIYLTGLLKELNEIMNEKYFVESCVLVIYAPWHSHRISVGGKSETNILYRGFDNYDLLSYLPGALDVSPRVSLSSRRGSPGHRHWLAGSCVNT